MRSCPSTSIRCEEPSAPGTSSSPARASTVRRRGTLRDSIDRLDHIAAMGFDVVYLPPIHPIGLTHRKGRNGATSPAPDDVGSPWAIGSPAGGHTAVDPDLGTVDDVTTFASACRDRGMELALDIAFQCSPDHPWVTEHPEWFAKRADGSIQYAENPPKKYQDIYPIDFESDDWQNLWQALADVIRFWIERGVRTFRVDNPHTKAFAFWEWALGSIRREHPDTVFLAEAFTRPRVMERLAKIGFNQSYTYFAWRQAAWELREYFEDLSTRTVDCSARTPGRTPPTSSPNSSRPAGVLRSSAGRSWQRPSRRVGASTARRSSCSSTNRSARDRRSTSIRRSSRPARGTSTVPTRSRRCSLGSTRSAASTVRSGGSTRSASTRPTTRACSASARRTRPATAPPCWSWSTSIRSNATAGSSTSTSQHSGSRTAPTTTSSTSSAASPTAGAATATSSTSLRGRPRRTSSACTRSPTSRSRAT